ncbi:LysM repeat protein [Ereboglobus sp. PH5-5]|uniref:LysM peptidoglycan-binding domain-containing protein n=1 Tax=unclassified Ereboglobus TaxID=2626932 RepID=UPI0024058991|nr:MULTISPECIES: LysM domain-containing protein [unclassified Ereboglobus]MDF9828433.1 LysM repeat protein [Ereboglobus sp. PH5-10]MDF9834310.1 LysM repeat protein [Ereboglobus sp. PH5-5]
MDTISSHESNTNYLPLAGVITGGVALLLAIFAFVQVKSVKNDIADIRSLSDRVAGIETQLSQVAGAVQVANNANQVASNTHNSLMTVARETNASFRTVTEQLTALRDRLDKMGTRATTRPPQQAAAGNATAAAPVEAGTDVYTVKSGDNGTKIFRATGFSQAQLEAVNPGINWSRLAIGQRIVLPKK